LTARTAATAPLQLIHPKWHVDHLILAYKGQQACNSKTAVKQQLQLVKCSVLE
jgi:hypothetical protein